MPIDPKLFNALGGGQAQVPQQPAPAPAGSPAPGAGPSLFQALGEQPLQQMGAQPLILGPQVADNSDSGLMKGNPFYRGDTQGALEKTPPPAPKPRPSGKSASDDSLSTTATNFFNRMKK